MQAKAIVTSELQLASAKLKRARQEGEAWPLLVYDDVLTIADRWDTAGRGSGHKTVNAWLRAECFGGSWNLGRFKHVAAVVGALGEHVRRTWVWPAAQWVYNNVPDAELRRIILDSYPMWMRKNNDHPLSLSMLKKRVAELRK